MQVRATRVTAFTSELTGSRGNLPAGELTGLTPHQYVLRSRLREAAVRLCDQTRKPQPKILEVAFDCGFGDVSNFNRCFRAEFGMTLGHSEPGTE